MTGVLVAVQRNVDRIRYRLTVPTLERIAIDGSGDVRYTDLKGTSLTAEIDGSGEITVGGTVDAQTVQLSGSGTYSAPDLTTRSAMVSYRGTPTVQRTVAGAGDVTQVP